MRLLVCGAGGMLGRDVVRAGAACHDVVALDRSQLDLTDAGAVARRVAEERPDAVVNCAAYTDVDRAEDDLEAAMSLNADAARHLASAAAEVGASVVYPSTDYVFDGSKRQPYVESDEPRPQSVYGQTKLAGEHETREANPRHYVVRSSWLFGTGGRNFVETMLALAREHGEAVVVGDQVGVPTFTGHLANAIVTLIGTKAHGLHHLSAAGECSWSEFAEEIFARAGLDARVVPCSSGELGRPAPRPAYSVLASERPDALRLPEWTDGLDAYLAERAGAGAGGVARERT